MNQTNGKSIDFKTLKNLAKGELQEVKYRTEYKKL